MEAGRLNIKYQYQIKEFSTLCMGRCKPLGSLNSFLSYAPHSLGLILFPCSPYFWQSPSSKAITLERGAGSSFCWIAILAALIHIWKPGITDSCDISCLLIRQEIFSLHMKIPLKHAPKFLWKCFLPRSLKMVYYFLLQALVGPKVLLSSGKVQFKAQEQECKLNSLKPQLGSRNPWSGS